MNAQLGKRWRLLPLIYVALATAWLLGVPPWQGPDEPGHYEYARLLARLQRAPHPRDADPALQARIIRSLDAHAFWQITHQPRPAPLPTRFEENPFLRRSGSQLGNESPLYYLIPAALFSLLPDDPALHVRVGRAYSAMLGLLFILVAGAAARRRFPRPSHLALTTVGVVTLLPMPTFIHSTFNPNILGDLLGALFFALAWPVVRAGGRASTLRWSGLLLTALLALVVKRTTLVFPVLTGWLLLMLPRSPLRPWRRHLALVAFGLAAALFLFPHAPHRAAEWERGPERDVALRAVGQGLDGSAAFLVMDESETARGYIAQDLLDIQIPQLWGETVQAEARVRAVGKAAWACLAVVDAWGESATCTRADNVWVPLTLRRRVPRGTPYIRVVLGVGAPHNRMATGRLLADGLTLHRVGRDENLLRNGGAEHPLSRPLFVWREILHQVNLGPRYVYVPQRWTAPVHRRVVIATIVLFASFWGNFGWLQYPLPHALYILLALVTLAALAGVARAAGRVNGEERGLMAFDALAVGLTLTGSMVPVLGADWLPQGRYLFPVLLPAMALGLCGLETWRPRTCSAACWAWAWLSLVGGFSIFALVWTIIQMRGGISI